MTNDCETETAPFYCSTNLRSYESVAIDATRSDHIPLIRNERRNEIFNHWIYLIGLLTVFVIGTTIGGYLLYTQMRSDNSENFELIPRQYWSPFNKSLSIPLLQLPIENILLTIVDSEHCEYESQCLKVIRGIQKKQIQMQFEDIRYNFIIANDGRVYEGRGWIYEPYCENCNSKTLFIAILGDINTAIPKSQQEQLEAFIDFSMSNNQLNSCYEILTTHQKSRHLIDAAYKLYQRNIRDNICR